MLRDANLCKCVPSANNCAVVRCHRCGGDRPVMAGRSGGCVLSVDPGPYEGPYEAAKQSVEEWSRIQEALKRYHTEPIFNALARCLLDLCRDGKITLEDIQQAAILLGSLRDEEERRAKSLNWREIAIQRGKALMESFCQSGAIIVPPDKHAGNHDMPEPTFVTRSAGG